MRSMGVDADSKGLFTRVTLPLAVFGLINQAARTVLAVIGPVLAVEFALSASELGMLAACMLAAYALAQLPGGMALDRVGARNVQAALSLVTAVARSGSVCMQNLAWALSLAMRRAATTPFPATSPTAICSGGKPPSAGGDRRSTS